MVGASFFLTALGVWRYILCVNNDHAIETGSPVIKVWLANLEKTRRKVHFAFDWITNRLKLAFQLASKLSSRLTT